jgi:hypothetical protein
MDILFEFHPQIYVFSASYQRNTVQPLTEKMVTSRTLRHSPEASSLMLRQPP